MVEQWVCMFFLLSGCIYMCVLCLCVCVCVLNLLFLCRGKKLATTLLSILMSSPGSAPRAFCSHLTGPLPPPRLFSLSDPAALPRWPAHRPFLVPPGDPLHCPWGPPLHRLPQQPWESAFLTSSGGCHTAGPQSTFRVTRHGQVLSLDSVRITQGTC